MRTEKFVDMNLQSGDKIKVYCDYFSESPDGALEGQRDNYKESITGYYAGFHPKVNKYYYRTYQKAYSPSEPIYDTAPAILITESFDKKNSRDITDLINNTNVGRVMLLECIKKIKVL